ncbi:MAG: nitric-oxide reductase large subunit, partial [Bryobacteraceae bacterium]
WIGTRIYQEMPPIPDRVVTREGRVVIGDAEVGQGQNIWQTMGGMEVGSVWGHDSYVAPDWTADSLRRELEYVLNEWAEREHGKEFEALDAEQKGALQGRVQKLFRTITYDRATRTIVIDEVRARAFEANVAYYRKLFAEGEPAYAIPKGAVPDAERARKLVAFFWWTAWSASTNRPGGTITYTHNWPHEPLVGNRPTGESMM